MNNVTFKAGRKIYTVTEASEFMDNDACIQFFSDRRNSVIVPKKEWQRLKPLLHFKCYRKLSLVVKIYVLNPAEAPKRYEFKTDDQVNKAFLALRSQVIDSYGIGQDEEDRFEATIMDEADKLFFKEYGWTYTAALDDVEIKMAAGDQ